MNIIIKILFLSIMWNYINVGIKSLQKYDVNVKFSIFRSICCLTMVIYALINIVKYGKKAINNPFFSTAFDIKDLNELFVAYLLHDVINMAITKTDRLELWFHHLFSILTFTAAPKLLNNSPYLLNVLLLAEFMSVVSGIDSMYISNDEMVNSMYCKKFRIFVIRYIRTPIWIYSFISSIMSFKKLPNLVIINGLIATIVMPLLDNYWANKCKKVINKYETKKNNDA